MVDCHTTTFVHVERGSCSMAFAIVAFTCDPFILEIIFLSYHASSLM